MRWNSTTSCAIWHGDDGGVYARELYSHPDGAENDYDVLIENLAEAPEHAALVQQLHARVVAKNGGCLAKNPNKPKSVAFPQPEDHLKTDDGANYESEDRANEASQQAAAAANGWHGPIDVEYGDKDCPNVGCHGPWKGVHGPEVCEGICDGLQGCNAMNFVRRDACSI